MDALPLLLDWLAPRIGPGIGSAPMIVGIAGAQGSGNPTGVRVEFLDSYTSVAAPVPEPASYAMILAGLLVVGGVARRRLG